MVDEIKRRTTRSPAEWRQHCEEWKMSGETQGAFCRARGLNYSRFVYWRGKFNKAHGETKPAQFAPVQVTPTVSSAAPIQLSLSNGVRVALHRGADMTLLGEILTLLKVR